MELASLIVAIISLIIAVFSFIVSAKAQVLQNKVNELELKLKQYELERIREEESNTKSSCVEARVIKIAKGQYRLKIWNSGNTTTYGVSVRIDEDANIHLIATKTPYEKLEPRKSYEEVLLVSFESKQKFLVVTEWMDEQGNQKSKEQIVSY